VGLKWILGQSRLKRLHGLGICENDPAIPGLLAARQQKQPGVIHVPKKFTVRRKQRIHGTNWFGIRQQDNEHVSRELSNVP